MSSPAAGNRSPLHLRFRIGSRYFALPVQEVSQVAPLRSIREVPLTPDFIRGLMEHQGRLLTVLDAERLLGHPSLGRPPEENLLVLSGPFQHLALAIPGFPQVASEPNLAADGAAVTPIRDGAGEPEKIGILKAEELVRHCRDRMDRFRSSGGPSTTTAGGE